MIDFDTEILRLEKKKLVAKSLFLYAAYSRYSEDIIILEKLREIETSPEAADMAENEIGDDQYKIYVVAPRHEGKKEPDLVYTDATSYIMLKAGEVVKGVKAAEFWSVIQTIDDVEEVVAKNLHSKEYAEHKRREFIDYSLVGPPSDHEVTFKVIKQKGKE